ncbi:hypothetical protein GXW78_24305 [Roseomonas terrae]|uniref:Class I SAM-dependent methyltransferase n=1 Tax=Neoroseomonas terrae TaxID=424799 RepID=A0ABS5EP55_9PROT|nr:hypothetical protein [Neoroseomonas terrae]MBR0652801.1 hypothetical protein [Neoroseomonas terrae]
MSDEPAPLSQAEIDQYTQQRTGGDRTRLEWHGFKVHSQSDEDGIIERIFSLIGTTDRRFVEFGCESGSENNTHYLLDQGWTGLWMEGNPNYAPLVREKFRAQIASGQVRFVETFVTPDNINAILKEQGVTGEIDFLSIDIDSNDHHVFEAIDAISPRLVCIEHNHTFPPGVAWEMPYDTDFRWDPASGEAPYGASITSMAALAARRGYVLVGCGLCSANGFYVRSDLVGDHFTGPFTPEGMFNPLEYKMILRYPARSPAPAPAVPARPGILARLRQALGM